MNKSGKPAYIPKSWETVNCPFCETGFAESDIYERFGSEKQYTYVKCRNCGLVYSSPRPAYDQHFIDSAYASYYQYADNIQLSDLENIRESVLSMFEKELVHISVFDTLKKSVLDIGSGMGTFLLAAKKYYPVAVGLDVSVKMAAFVEKNIGVKVYVEQLENFHYPEKFSLVHMSHVLEHVPDPNLWIRKVKDLMYSGGILVINVPNKLSLSNQFKYALYKMGIRKRVSSSMQDPASTPDHLFEPTVRSLRYLLLKHDLEILELYTYSRRDPVSNASFFTRLMKRRFKTGTNISAICRVK